jgi:chromate reductase
MAAPTTDSFFVLGISGSLRRHSYNTSLLRLAGALLPKGVGFDIVDLSDIPLYNADVEREEGFPPPVARLRARIARADALVVATPEYNRSVPGVLKNAIDWLSRGPESPLDDKPTAILGAGGRSGTARAQQHLREILVHNRVAVLSRPEVLVARAWDQFTAEGDLADNELIDLVGSLMTALVEEAGKVTTDDDPAGEAARIG